MESPSVREEAGDPQGCGTELTDYLVHLLPGRDHFLDLEETDYYQGARMNSQASSWSGRSRERERGHKEPHECARKPDQAGSGRT